MKKTIPPTKVLAHKLRFLLREDEVITVTGGFPFDSQGYWLHGVMDGRSIELPMRGQEDLEKVLQAAKDLPVVNSKEEDHGVDPVKPTKKIEAKVEAKPPAKVEVKPDFVPPKVPATPTRQRISSTDVRGKELWSRFLEVSPVPYPNQKKLTEDQHRDRDEWKKMQEVARSYLLANEYAVVTQWIGYLEKHPNYYQEWE
jgi:hypothetical protein